MRKHSHIDLRGFKNMYMNQMPIFISLELFCKLDMSLYSHSPLMCQHCMRHSRKTLSEKYESDEIGGGNDRCRYQQVKWPSDTHADL